MRLCYSNCVLLGRAGLKCTALKQFTHVWIPPPPLIFSMIVPVKGWVNVASYQDGSRSSCLRFLKVVCQSCTKLHLKLPGDFHTRLLASTVHFLKTLQQERDHYTDAPANGSLGKVKTTLREESRGPESGDICEEGYRLVVSLLEGCDSVLLSELLEGSCSEIVSNCNWNLFFIVIRSPTKPSGALL